MFLLHLPLAQLYLAAKPCYNIVRIFIFARNGENNLITIKEVAERANVSRTTVSRVLNNSGYIGAETRERVLKVIRETGYVPSEQAKSLRTKKTKVIGVILPKISTETSSRLVAGIDEVLAENGYQIILFNSNLDPDKEIEGIRLLKSRNVDGIILSATNIREELIKEIGQLKIPFVSIGQTIPGVSHITYKDYEAAKEAASLLLNKGHRNIAFIGVSESDPSVGYWRKKGYADALAGKGIQYNGQLVRIGSFDVDTGYKGMKEMFQSDEPKPTALLAVSDRIAIGAISYLKEAGYSIPEDCAVIGMGGSEMSQYITPSLTTIDFDTAEAGQMGAKTLIETIENKSINIQKIQVNYRLIKRDSI